MPLAKHSPTRSDGAGITPPRASTEPMMGERILGKAALRPARVVIPPRTSFPAAEADNGYMPPIPPRLAVGRHLTDPRLALVVAPTTIVIALRRRARRKAGSQAWRYRTHHEASADSARIVSAHHEDELDAGAQTLPHGQLKPRAVR